LEKSKLLSLFLIAKFTFFLYYSEEVEALETAWIGFRKKSRVEPTGTKYAKMMQAEMG
jgi:hypothetical protein